MEGLTAISWPCVDRPPRCAKKDGARINSSDAYLKNMLQIIKTLVFLLYFYYFHQSSTWYQFTPRI